MIHIEEILSIEMEEKFKLDNEEIDDNLSLKTENK